MAQTPKVGLHCTSRAPSNPSRPSTTTTSATLTPSTEVVATHSESDLDSVADEILTLDDISGASSMNTAWVDAENNRVAITVPAVGRRPGGPTRRALRHGHRRGGDRPGVPKLLHRGRPVPAS
jgi:hypothetical protein